MIVELLLTHLIFFISIVYIILIRTKTILSYFQQEEYDTSRFVKKFFQIRLYDIVSSTALGVLLLVGNFWDIVPISMLIASAVFFATALKEQKYKLKKSFVSTERSLRIKKIATAIMVILALSTFISPVFALLILQLPVVAIFLADLALKPIQRSINEGFINEAEQRLENYSGTRIGITGSFGKTSIKHILGHLLAVDSPVFYSKGSINTILGLTRHIRQRLQFSHRYFIAEMGAYQKGSIKNLCEFIKPDYGIVSSVGDAHTERFGSVEEIAKAKSELALWVCKYGELVVTTEEVASLLPFKQLRQKYPEKFVICGYSESADIQLIEEKLTSNGWELELKINGVGSGNATNVRLPIPLLGQHSNMNVSLIIGLISRITPDLIQSMANSLKHLPQIPHRLQMQKQQGGPLILDDAYNSNEKGFINAITSLNDLAKASKGRGVLVTPGVAELGTAHDEVHKRLAEVAVEKCDLIVVVNPSRILSFVGKIKEKNYKGLYLFETLNDAQVFLKTLSLEEKDIILYENDLPDLLEDHRFL